MYSRNSRNRGHRYSSQRGARPHLVRRNLPNPAARNPWNSSSNPRARFPRTPGLSVFGAAIRPSSNNFGAVRRPNDPFGLSSPVFGQSSGSYRSRYRQPAFYSPNLDPEYIAMEKSLDATVANLNGWFSFFLNNEYI